MTSDIRKEKCGVLKYKFTHRCRDVAFVLPHVQVYMEPSLGSPSLGGGSAGDKCYELSVTCVDNSCTHHSGCF